MPSAVFTSPASLDSPGSLEQINSSEAYPKVLNPQRVSSYGEVERVEDGGQLPFPLLPGECVQSLGQMSARTQLFLTNYRVFVLLHPRSFHNIPSPSIDSVEIRDLFYLHINCKDGRIVKVESENNETCMTWFKLLNSVACGKEKLEQMFAFCFWAWCKDEKRHFALKLRSLDAYVLPNLAPGEISSRKASTLSEFRRLGFDDNNWRICDRNENFKVCDTYPEYVIVPGCVKDSDVEESARYRFLNRFPALVWRDRVRGSVLLRSSQPSVGIFGWRCAEDEFVLNAFADTAAKHPAAATSLPFKSYPTQTTTVNGNPPTITTPDDNTATPNGIAPSTVKPLLILDARSYTAAWANRAKGGGFESPEYYQKCEIQYLGLANIHAIRNSFQQLRTLLGTELSDPNTWLQSLQGTQWLQHMSNLLSAAVRVCEALRDSCRSVLVHCSDGWDRTPQIVSLATLLLDPYYRTMTGFRELVEREWISFGHKFADRSGLVNQNPNERSPVFLQWLDCVYQLLLQYPAAFQFNHSYLVKMAHHCYSGLFGTFLCNSLLQGLKNQVSMKTFAVWTYLHPDNVEFRNEIYEPIEGPLWPRTQVRDIVLWKQVYGSLEPAGSTRPRSGSVQSTGQMDRSMTRAHSCDSLNSGTDVGVGNSSGSNLGRTGSESNIHAASPHFNNSGGALNLAGSVSKEEVSLVLEQVISRVSESEESPSGLLTEGLLNGNGYSPAPPNEIRETAQDVDTVDNNSTRPHPSHPPPPPPSTTTQATCRHRLAEFSIATTEEEEEGENTDMQTSTSDISDSYVRRLLRLAAAQPNSSRIGKNGYCNGPTVTVVEQNGQGSSDVPWEGRRRKERKSIADWLDCDGLTVVVDPWQDKTRAMRQSYERRIEFLEGKLQQMRSIRAIQRQQNGYPCQMCNGTSSSADKTDGESAEPGSVDSVGGRSDVSWEAVDDGDANPTKWIPDHAVSHCMGCDTEFWTINRKHHCRACGKIFCSACSSFETPVPTEQLYEPVRVCNTCYTALQSSSVPLLSS